MQYFLCSSVCVSLCMCAKVGVLVYLYWQFLFAQAHTDNKQQALFCISKVSWSVRMQGVNINIYTLSHTHRVLFVKIYNIWHCTLHFIIQCFLYITLLWCYAPYWPLTLFFSMQVFPSSLGWWKTARMKLNLSRSDFSPCYLSSFGYYLKNVQAWHCNDVDLRAPKHKYAKDWISLSPREDVGKESHEESARLTMTNTSHLAPWFLLMLFAQTLRQEKQQYEVAICLWINQLNSY